MTDVGCWLSECKWCKNGWCQRGSITIAENLECEDFVHYADSKEYDEKHYIAVKVEGEAAKAIKYGKKFEINGITFYTRDRTDYDGYRLTHGRTGYDVGTKERLMSCWDKFLEYEKAIPDVETLPLAEENADGNYELVKEGDNNEQR